MTTTRGTDAPPSGGDDEPAGAQGEARKRGRLHTRLHSNPLTALVSKIVVTILGIVVILAGIIMLFTPGQGILAVILGLWILRFEYEWADRWLAKVRAKAHEARMHAQEMDPKVRRRRILIASALTVLVAAVVVAYVVGFGWPSPAVDGWDWVQGFAAWIPELPGM